MAAGLQTLLQDLHSCIAEDPQFGAAKAHDVVGDVAHICLQDADGKEIDYCCSLLFNKDHGVTTFIKKVCQNEEYQSAKVELLEMLLSFITKFQQKAVPYAVDIKDACMSVFVRERLSKVKLQTIPLLIELLKQVAGSKVAQELNVEKMIDKFFMEMTKPSKYPATVKQQMLHLLGVFAMVFPEKMINYSERLFDMYIKTLKTEMTSKTKKPELSVISGCLQGLTCLLTQFSQSAEEGSEHSYNIYKYARMAIDPDIKYTRYEMPRSGLDLLARHAVQFNQYLLDEHEMMYGRLSFWCGHSNRDMLHAGMYAMEAFLQQVSETLVLQAANGKKDGATFKFFIQKFRSIMDSPSANDKEIGLAIKGYGYFAAPCKEFLTDADVKFMFNEMIQRSEQVFFSQQGEAVEDKVIGLPSFLEALASIIRELDQVSEVFLLSLERLVVLLIEHYPKLSRKLHHYGYVSVLKVCFSLFSKGAVFKGFLSRIVYQGLIRSCSHPVAIAVDDPGENVMATDEEVSGRKQRVSYRDYLEMWTTFLNSHTVKELAQLGLSLDERHAFTQDLYDELIAAILRVLDRLDLTSTATSTDDTLPEEEGGGDADNSLVGVSSADPTQGLTATKPKDFMIFINLVDLCRDLLPKRKVQLFKKWVFTFGHSIILLSTKCPLVSGFYKLLAVCASICTKLNYFQDINMNNPADSQLQTAPDSAPDAMDVAMETVGDEAQRAACFMLFSKFTKEVLQRLKQYKDDLLAACLSLILALPTEIVTDQLSNIVPALKITFTLGQSYLPLAQAGLAAIQLWSVVLPPAVMNPHYKHILPALDAFLKSSVDTASDIARGDQTVALTSTKPTKQHLKRQGKKKIPVKLLKPSKEKKSLGGVEAQLSEVQQQCVCLLGSLGGAVNSALVVSTAEEIGAHAVAWDRVHHLKFVMPFVDIKPTIYLDPFLPRIVDLALTSTERQTKVAACELLHSLVLYMLGRGSQQPEPRAGRAGTEEIPATPMSELYRHIFPAAMKLACDVEQVARQLFEPLCLQLIHWFTSNKMFGSDNTYLLLTTILDGLVNPTNTGLRDFSALCVREYLKWSIKQITQKQMERSPHNIKMLVKSLYQLARHPSADKRLGAALAYNNIYTVFREEEALVDQFAFEILKVFVESLAHAHNDDKSLGTQQQCRQVLRHLERIILKKADLLSSMTDHRRKPRGWLDATLNTAVRWLVRQCGRPQTECRHACMELVCKLAVAIEGVSEPKDFFNALVSDYGPEYFILRFENDMHGPGKNKHGLHRYQCLTQMGEAFSLKSTLNWFDMLTTPLDCYLWVFGEGLLSPAKTLLVGGVKAKGTCLLKVLDHFLNDLALGGIDDAARLFKGSTPSVYTPWEREEYNRAKCTVIVRLINFVCVLLGKYKTESLKVIPGKFWSTSLWDTLIACVLRPTQLGFNMADVEILTNLPNETAVLLQVLSRSLPANIVTGFKKRLAHHLASNRNLDLFLELPSLLSEGASNYVTCSHLVTGYGQLFACGFLVDALPHKKATEKLAKDILIAVVQGLSVPVDGRATVATLSPTCRELAGHLLALGFQLGLKNSDLLDALLDKSPLLNPGTTSSSHSGAVLYVTFKSVVSSHIVSVAADFLPILCFNASNEWSIVGNMLLGILDHVSRDRNLRKKLGPAVLDNVLNNWHLLAPWWQGKTSTQETKTLTLSLLAKVMVNDSKVVTSGKHSSFKVIFAMYCSLLIDKETTLSFKSRGLDLLPFFTSVPDVYLPQLRENLDRLVADNFPANSSEYPVNSPKYNDYITALNKILYALELSGSELVLELVLSVLCKEQRHVYEDNIQSALARFIKRLPMDRHKPILDVSYNIYSREGGYRNDQRRAAIERVCVPMLRLVHTGAMVEFFMDHIRDITAVVDAKPMKGSEVAMETQLVSRLGSLLLLEVMYSRLPKDDLNSKNSKINNAYRSGKVDTGKELTMAMTKACHTIRSEDIRGETTLLELRRLLHCSAYNALIAIISCTQSDVKFYHVFLFKEDNAKGQFVWENIVDSKRKYEFPVEMEAPMARRKRFVSIRNEVRGREHTEAADGEMATRSVHYLASQYLADSSLSSDVSQFDFGGTISASVLSSSSAGGGSSYSRMRRNSSASDPVDLDESAVTVSDDYVEMEMDELNQHECMAPLTALLQHMIRNKVAPQPEKGATLTALPAWMDTLHRKLQSSTTPINIKLFLVKLIVNAEEVFRPYARFWISPLVHLIVSGELGRYGIHYFITDIVVTILSWHTVCIPEDTTVDRAMATRLAEFLMQQCHNDNRQALRNNLEVIKTLVEVWRTRIEVPTKVLHTNFTDSDPKSKRNGTGIQMVGVVLANRLSPYRPGTGVDKDRFYQHLATNMTSPMKVTYAASAEVTGLVLQLMADTERGEDETSWRETFEENIGKMLLSVHQSKPDQFITCVHKMQTHYPPMADRFLSQVLFMLPKVHGEYRTHCVDILQHRVDSIANVFTEMKDKNILNILSHRDEGTQQMALKLVQGMMRHLKPGEVTYLLPAVTAFGGATSTDCRTVMYNILMWLYDQYRDEEGDEVNTILTQAKETLLKGLADDDLKNRLTVQNFWSHESRLPTGTLERLVSMLEAMHSPASEAQYLSYATNLLLEMTSKSPDYSLEMFEHPLSECKFEDYRVSHSWRQRHVAMTPLFVETQQTQAGADGDSPLGESLMSTQVRATQDTQQFTATQQGGSKAPFNWLTQSSMDTYSDTNITMATDTQSSLLFNVGSGSGRPGRRGTGAGLGGPRVGVARPTEEAASQGSDILRLKRRFIKDKESTNVYFAKKMSRLKRLKEDVNREQKKRRENQVTMYRRYRIGDLPDIQMKYSYLIAPLQALAQRDSVIARQLFSALFQAIFLELENEKTEREARETVETIQKCINNMLSTSTQYTPPFVSCLLDIAYGSPRKLSVDPGTINTVCVTAAQQPLGVVLLEETLIQAEGELERPTKRAKVSSTATVSKETSTWVELARLYKSIEDYDTLRGIFSSRFGTQKLTSQALDAEMKGDYQSAAKIYSDGLAQSDWDEAPNDVEIDMWDESRLQCYNQLLQWDRLEQQSSAGVGTGTSGGLDGVWDDTYSQEHYLPYLLRAKLKSLQNGDDGQQDLLSFVDKALRLPEQRALLETRYTEELALVYLHQEDYDRASHYARQASELFLRDWGEMDSLMDRPRRARLQRLQPITELTEFLDFIRDQRNLDALAPANKLVAKWMKRSPNQLMDPVNIWDDIVTNRCVYMDHMAMKLEDAASSQMDVDGEGTMFERQKVLLRLAQANSACKQDNFPVSLKLLKNVLPGVRELQDDSLQLQWAHTYAHTHHAKTSTWKTAPEEAIRAITGTLDQLNKNDAAAAGSRWRLRCAHNLLQADAFQLLTATLHGEDVRLAALPDSLQQKIMDMSGCAKLDTDEVVHGLVMKGYQLTKTAVGLASQHTGTACGTDDDTSQICKAHMALVAFCDTHLRHIADAEEESDAALPPAFNQFPTAVVTSLLTAMKLNDSDAQQLFPRLLQLVEEYPDTMATFVKKALEVPCWMFIAWIGQMTALLDKPESSVVQDILLRIAHQYPDALVYPFKMSSEDFQFESNAVGKKAKTVTDQIKEQLSKLRLVDTFVSSLEQLEQPNLIFKDDLIDDEEFKKYITKPKKYSAEIKDVFKRLYHKLLDTTTASEADLYDESFPPAVTQDSIPKQLGMGPYRQKFAKAFANDILRRFGKDGNKIMSLSYPEINKNIRSVAKEMTDKTFKNEDLSPPVTLKEYSPYLASFQGFDHPHTLEIPGQYNGIGKPLPEYHTKVASFHEKVLVLSSLRKPKRITISGDDEKDYPFLVKGGEDLRQDQRIEQLYGIMNRIFQSDPACHQRRLRLRTYGVIPMTPRVGLIEWMANTMVLKEMLMGARTEREAAFMDSQNKGPRCDHLKFIGSGYHDVYKRCSRSDTVTAFKKRENMVPWDLARRAYQNMAASPEAYFVLRSNFAASHALLCICQYVLGIGDRHLSNFMVDTQTGNMVGIDFGHNFGSATQFLPIPELMPIRLTRQLRNLLLPLREKGALEGVMIHSLRALSANSHTLLNTMDVFIKEPSLDWKNFAKKQVKKMSELGADVEELETDQEWYPRQKIAFARKKLEGYNPVYITRDELKLGHARTPYYKYYEQVLLGDPAVNVRAQLPKNGLNVEQQVAALLDQATDPNILGRVWVGWESWV